MASTTFEPINGPSKDLEMTDAQHYEAKAPVATANGDDNASATPNGGAEQSLQTEAPTDTAHPSEQQEQQQQQPSTQDASESADATKGGAEEPKLSKNQLRKMKRKAAWEEGREDRKRKRKEKRHDRQVARRETIAAAVAAAEAVGIDPAEAIAPLRKKAYKPPAVQVPVSLILDCDFEKYMLEKEQISLASQITRCYSDNRGAAYRAHLYVSSYGGLLKQRFETTLGNQHLHWKGVKLVEGNFVEAARDADEVMKGPRGGTVIDLLKPTTGDGETKKPAVTRDVYDNQPSPDAEPEPADELKNIVYLSSDSVNTLDRLEPGVSYVIGGLVDRNREKGLCHRRARELGIRTAKLPIGKFMNLSSRRVLATNHVVEIMLKWLETGDWAEAFLSVIPKRKEAKLKGEDGSVGGTPVAEGEVEDSRFEEENDEDVDEKETITESVAVPEEPKAQETTNAS
ncbi:tRNA (guanine(9)-N1)-methyltransferase [Colletotrichum orbiculare MAFF 240422]|uniref:tRNA (guanine(9)-N1)-methyltransferase n=1 Tax=Colletotrichum orbiculare (strain 104-T / ATCC 96160 / CBS 514.97 / LARS 414 / MAFF 240422) TaxID=1213857 RepID=N4VY82_COLOR|nr:tRNA (guanine(9)-N1)-methyltransferase [Colletotrichum orbiculare MAFF 240422]